jgi:tRNA (mo5U34)-methyltransferase
MDYAPLFEALSGRGLGAWAERLREQLPQRFSASYHGDYPRWQALLERLPALPPRQRVLDGSCIAVGAEDPDPPRRQALAELLRQFHPWRKGPYCIHGVRIDSEWRSDWKWDRLERAIAPLHGRLVLDVGCGNGYHCWRMAGAGAGLVLGIDPSLLYVMQFLAVQHFLRLAGVQVLPLAVEDLAPEVAGFDTVFSMGVLAHRRSPLDHLMDLRRLLRPGGELVLETLVLEGPRERVLVPRDRYARMRNVWFIPSPDALLSWLVRCGFRQGRLVDVTATTPEEQRSTPWMRFQSLRDFLDPEDPTRTLEGYPAPLRGIFVAKV